jgi:hypothetical protein
MAGYGGVDYIDFDSQLNDEEKLVRQTARQFVENEIVPIIEKPSSATWVFLAPTCMDMVARECPM